ncbi:putative methyltransferase-domain-containing protein [Xylariomycetidae sp. FL2044]|nr:putative methyltransferase-domain-containing protein [Xylariomycetidae sp. FL2044]
MFAVRGWAVSADNLKPETAAAKPAREQQEESQQSQAKKRKRPSGHGDVNSFNVADLWERVIEGRDGKKARTEGPHHQGDGTTKGPHKKMTLKEKKKLKKLKMLQEAAEAGGLAENQVEEKSVTNVEDDGPSSKEPKKNKKRRKSKGAEGGGSEETTSTPATTSNSKELAKKPASAPAPPKLTPMQAAMREKLVSARFRHLNETLYTKPSTEAFQLFRDTPEMFQEYHEGFRRQVDVWPENPVDRYIEEIKQRAAVAAPSNQRHRGKSFGNKSQQQPHHSTDATSSSPLIPLPRTSGTCTIVDLGCGDAKLSAALQPHLKKLRLDVRSYDLQSPSPLVTRADIADLPLADGAADVAVFCLALMGTNWLDFVEEAYRVLHWKGELWVAEIKSRFGNGKTGSGKGGNHNNPVSHSVGNRRKGAAAGGGKKGGKGDVNGDENNAAEQQLAVEVDGAEDLKRGGETDVSAFVEALRKRGFVIQGEPDLRNKMFVKMRFLKAASPVVGKGVAAAAAASAAAGGQNKQHQRGAPSGGGMRKSGIKFIDDGDKKGGDGAVVSEASILKPCVYKIR